MCVKIVNAILVALSLFSSHNKIQILSSNCTKRALHFDAAQRTRYSKGGFFIQKRILPNTL